MDHQDRESIVSEPPNIYDAYYNDRKEEVRAPTLYAAKLAAIGAGPWRDPSKVAASSASASASATIAARPDAGTSPAARIAA